MRGGRISKASGFVGNVLNICPLLNMDYEGKLIPREKIRTKKKVIKRIVEKMAENAENGMDYSGKCYICQSECMEQLNGNIHYQMFCDVIIDPTRPLTNYKLLDDIMLELAGKLKIQQLQDILAEQWKPYMQNLDTLYTDATCYESEMRYPTDPKLLWEGIEKSYETMCELSKRLRIHRPRTKFIDVQKANLAYRKQRKHSKSQTRKMTRRLLELLGKILKEIRKMERAYENAQSLLTAREKVDLEIITKMYRQQKNHFQSKDRRESIPNRIVSISKPYVRPIVRGKEG